MSRSGPYVVGSPGCRTSLSADTFCLTRLCGFPLAEDAPIETEGHLALAIDNRVVPAPVSRAEAGMDDRLELQGAAGDSGLTFHTVMQAYDDIVEVSTRLANEGSTPLRITRCSLRIILPRGDYRAYSQASRWCHESQGYHHDLRAGSLVLGNVPGRTTEGGTPFVVLRRADGGDALACHLLPTGNWRISCRTLVSAGARPVLSVEAGLSDENLALELVPGQSVDLPIVLLQRIEGGLPETAAPSLHRHLLTRFFPSHLERTPPVIYNTWFDQFDCLDRGRLRAQLNAAQDLGCETFVIDAGWYGVGEVEGGWSQQTGDWRERVDDALCGEMKAFADEVRAAGLGFGLWMEPERFASAAPVRSDHPDWFVPVGRDGASARIDIERDDARLWLDAEIRRLIEDYGLEWMKIDFNFSLGMDSSGAELYRYYRLWYELIDGVRRDHPETFIEGCASGAMRCEAESLSHFDAHFLSDSVNPIDMIRISEGTWLRVPPGLLSRWAVVRSCGQSVPEYGKPVTESAPVTLVPRRAIWEPAETYPLSFVLAAALPGAFGLSGDPAGLDPCQKEELADWIAFYKRRRDFIRRSSATVLCPSSEGDLGRLDVRTGFSVVELTGDGDGSMVFAYHLGSGGAAPTVGLSGVRADRRYTVRIAPTEEVVRHDVTGEELKRLELSRILPVHDLSPRAAVLIIAPSGA